MLQGLPLTVLLGFALVPVLLGISGADRAPKYFAMEEEYEAVASRETVFTFAGKDSLVDHSVELLSDSSGFPLLFYSDILTPVCIDNVCKPMSIEIYWDLLGGYVGYGVIPEEPLTKFDHDLFEEENYLQLHELLLDRHSILERRALSDLFDPTAAPAEQVTFKGQEVDAVSGATIKEISESVVEGALYSCYTIWHIVHGEASRKMGDYLDSIYAPPMADYFLRSDHGDYQQYALRHFNEQDIRSNLPRIVDIFGEAKPLDRRYILKKIPDELWQEDSTINRIYREFSKLDINSKTILVENLELAQPEAAEILASELSSMTQNQLKSYLAYLTDHPELLAAEKVLPELEKAALSTEYTYSYLIKAFLEKNL